LKIVSEEVFRIWLKELYSYDKSSLNERTVSVEDNSPYYRKEEVEFDAAYGGERVTAFLFLPKSAQPPYQVVIYFPGWGAVSRSREALDPSYTFWDFFIKSGRAFMYPLYKNTHEQRKRDISGSGVKYRDWIVELSKDVRRSVDYLETRKDIDSNRLAYFGFSWGAWMGTIVLAIEERFDTGILAMGGLTMGYTSMPSGQPFNFVPRIKIPILMVNGREDSLYPLETKQVPLYKLLGIPEEHKKHITYPRRHSLIGSSRVQMQKDIIAWLDKYLGPVD
jgi:dienelactone hydrolase